MWRRGPDGLEPALVDVRRPITDRLGLTKGGGRHRAARHRTPRWWRVAPAVCGVTGGTFIIGAVLLWWTGQGGDIVRPATPSPPTLIVVPLTPAPATRDDARASQGSIATVPEIAAGSLNNVSRVMTTTSQGGTLESPSAIPIRTEHCS